MRFPQVLVYESDGQLARLLREAEKSRSWSPKEPRKLDTCLKLLQRGGPNVLVLRVGLDVGQEMTILERVTYLFPETAVVVMLDSPDPVMAGLTCDLGAHYVMIPPVPPEHLPQIVEGLLRTEVERPPGVEAVVEDEES